MPHALQYYYREDKSIYVKSALQLIGRMYNEDRITIREMRCLQRAILKNNNSDTNTEVNCYE